MKAKEMALPRQIFKTTHNLYGDKTCFDSWIQLVDETLELAEEEAKKRLMSQLVDLTMKISDEMIATVVIYEA